MEAVSTVTVIAALGSLSSTILFNAIDSYTQAATHSQIQAELSIGLDQIVREIRKIPLEEDGSLAPSIDSVSPESIAWADGSSIGYAGSAVVFVGSGLPAVTLLEDISACAFQYYDDDGAPLPTSMSGPACQAIRRIEVSMSLQRYGMTESLATSVHLRNTMQGGTP